MSSRRSYTISDKLFSTKAALKEYIQKILYSYKNDQYLTNDDFIFMLEVLKLHPDYELKKGVGIKAIFVKQNPVYRNARGFHLVRLDNKTTDFSYLECLKSTPHEKKFIIACRVAIEPYTQEYKRLFFNNLKGTVYTCPYTNEPLAFIGSHVDHKAPNTFQNLVTGFINENSINISEVKINSGAIDNSFQDTFADKKLGQLWIKYHNLHAELQVISKKANLSLPKV